MQSGVLERIRSFEADIESLVDSIVQQNLLSAYVVQPRHRILCDHFILRQTEKIKQVSEKLLDIYLDEDDIELAQTAPTTGEETIANAVREFEERAASIREYHREHRDIPPIKDIREEPDPALLDRLFSIKERYGSCIDLEEHYGRYCTFMISTLKRAEENTELMERGSAEGDESAAHSSEGTPATCGLEAHLRASGVSVEGRTAGTSRSSAGPLLPPPPAWRQWKGRVEYAAFLASLPTILLADVDGERKVFGFRQYATFVQHLLIYLLDFYLRIKPRESKHLAQAMSTVDSEAEEYWALLLRHHVDAREWRDASTGAKMPAALSRFAKSFSFWPLGYFNELSATTVKPADSPDGDGEAVAHAAVPSLSELHALVVMEGKVLALLQVHLFESLSQTEKAALRDFSKTADELEQERMAAAKEFHESLDEARRLSSTSIEASIALIAALDLQGEERYKMRQSAAGAGAAAVSTASLPPSSSVRPDSAVDDDGDATVDGALLQGATDDNQLLDSDGKPVPKWLVQLQQLDKRFPCEVCGGTVYVGPKVFREHFGAERHAEGLRRLGVTLRLKEFEGLATIRKVIELRDRLSAGDSLRKRIRADEDMEELQDAQGNVITAGAFRQLQQSRR